MDNMLFLRIFDILCRTGKSACWYVPQERQFKTLRKLMNISPHENLLSVGILVGII